MNKISAALISLCLFSACDSTQNEKPYSGIIHPKVFSMVTCWLSDTTQPVVTEINLDAVDANRNQFDHAGVSTKDGWIVYPDKNTGGFIRYRVLEHNGDSYRIMFQDNGGGTLTTSTTIGYAILYRDVTTPEGKKIIPVLKVESIE
jgi:hypothetical protein